MTDQDRESVGAPNAVQFSSVADPAFEYRYQTLSTAVYAVTTMELGSAANILSIAESRNESSQR